jgi:hypothetical protein
MLSLMSPRSNPLAPLLTVLFLGGGSSGQNNNRSSPRSPST